MTIVNIFKFFKSIYIQLSKNEKLLVWISLLFSVISAILPSSVLYLYALIIEQLSNKDFAQVYFLAIGFVVCGIFSSGIGTVSTFISNAINDIVWKITKQNILRATALPYELTIFEDKDKRKQLTFSLLFGNEIYDSISSLNAVFFGIIGLVPLFLLMSYAVWWIPIFIVLSLIPFVYFSALFERQSWDLTEAHEQEFSKMRIYERILTQPEFAKEIRLFEMQSGLIDKWGKFFNIFFTKAQHLRIKNSLKIILVSIFSAIVLFIPVVYIISEFIHDNISIGSISLILGGIFATKESISAIIYNYSDALRAAYHIKPYLDFTTAKLKSEPERVKDDLNPKSILEIKNLNFGFSKSTDLVLKNININLEENSSIAIVGDNGSGKTTLVKLICGFYQAFSGEILWNKKLERPKVLAIFQDFSKFPLTVAENLNLSSKDEAYAKMQLKKLDLDFLTKNFNAILSTEMGGQDLSLGQWQKLALGRLLVDAKEADLLIFDEPNSALDPESEAKVIKIILQLAKTKPSIIISHRMSVAKFVHKVIVLEKGAIVESGSHSELMELKNKYYAMFNAQAKLYL